MPIPAKVTGSIYRVDDACIWGSARTHSESELDAVPAGSDYLAAACRPRVRAGVSAGMPVPVQIPGRANAVDGSGTCQDLVKACPAVPDTHGRGPGVRAIEVPVM